MALTAFLVGYRFFTKPVVAASIGAVCVLAFLASCLDPNFQEIVKKAHVELGDLGRTLSARSKYLAAAP